MKASEFDVIDLMVGDWVVDTEFGKNTPDKVEIVEKNRVFLEHGKVYSLAEYIEPIPLKRIHLIKNGFRATNEDDSEFVYRDCYEIKVMFDGNPKDPIISLSIQFAEKELWMEIWYLHELQHAMRLFGITKEINL